MSALVKFLLFNLATGLAYYWLGKKFNLLK
jgi:hypothetical protein